MIGCFSLAVRPELPLIHSTSLFVNLYGVLIGIGIWLGTVAMEKAQLVLNRVNPLYATIVVDKLLLWLVIPGIVGARLYHVVDWGEYYAQHPEKIIAVWEGGIGIYGAMLGGFLGLLGYLYYHAQPKKTLNSAILGCALDLCAFGLPIGQAVGRVGNYFNQELFGFPTDLPWAIYIDAVYRPTPYAAYTHFHPLFLYEALLNLALAGWLWAQLSNLRYEVNQPKAETQAVHKESQPYLTSVVNFAQLCATLRQSFSPNSPGFFFAQYLIGYGLIRFGLDFLRIDPWQLGIFTIAQWVSLAWVGIGVVWLRPRRVFVIVQDWPKAGE